jgi:hypothetical protein
MLSKEPVINSGPSVRDAEELRRLVAESERNRTASSTACRAASGDEIRQAMDYGDSSPLYLFGDSPPKLPRSS